MSVIRHDAKDRSVRSPDAVLSYADIVAKSRKLDWPCLVTNWVHPEVCGDNIPELVWVGEQASEEHKPPFPSSICNGWKTLYALLFIDANKNGFYDPDEHFVIRTIRHNRYGCELFEEDWEAQEYFEVDAQMIADFYDLPRVRDIECVQAEGLRQFFAEVEIIRWQQKELTDSLRIYNEKAKAEYLSDISQRLTRLRKEVLDKYGFGNPATIEGNLKARFLNEGRNPARN